MKIISFVPFRLAVDNLIFHFMSAHVSLMNHANDDLTMIYEAKISAALCFEGQAGLPGVHHCQPYIHIFRETLKKIL